MAEAHVNFKFKIEAKPEGGFIARSDHPDLNVEGATKEEVEAKVLEKVSEMAGPQIAALLKTIKPEDLASTSSAAKPGIHIEKKFSIQVNTTRRSPAAPPSPDSAPTPAGEAPERAISPVVWYALLIVAALLLAWFLTHRR